MFRFVPRHAVPRRPTPSHAVALASGLLLSFPALLPADEPFLATFERNEYREVFVNWPTVPGMGYVLEGSNDLTNWSAVGPMEYGTGIHHSRYVFTADPPPGAPEGPLPDPPVLPPARSMNIRLFVNAPAGQPDAMVLWRGGNGEVWRKNTTLGYVFPRLLFRWSGADADFMLTMQMVGWSPVMDFTETPLPPDEAAVFASLLQEWPAIQASLPGGPSSPAPVSSSPGTGSPMPAYRLYRVTQVLLDTDADGLSDAWELAAAAAQFAAGGGFDPADPWFNPFAADSDGDGTPDFDPGTLHDSSADTDRDGVVNAEDAVPYDAKLTFPRLPEPSARVMLDLGPSVPPWAAAKTVALNNTGGLAWIGRTPDGNGNPVPTLERAPGGTVTGLPGKVEAIHFLADDGTVWVTLSGEYSATGFRPAGSVDETTTSPAAAWPDADLPLTIPWTRVATVSPAGVTTFLPAAPTTGERGTSTAPSLLPGFFPGRETAWLKRADFLAQGTPVDNAGRWHGYFVDWEVPRFSGPGTPPLYVPSGSFWWDWDGSTGTGGATRAVIPTGNTDLWTEPPAGFRRFHYSFGAASRGGKTISSVSRQREGSGQVPADADVAVEWFWRDYANPSTAGFPLMRARNQEAGTGPLFLMPQFSLTQDQPAPGLPSSAVTLAPGDYDDWWSPSTYYEFEHRPYPAHTTVAALNDMAAQPEPARDPETGLRPAWTPGEFAVDRYGRLLIHKPEGWDCSVLRTPDPASPTRLEKIQERTVTLNDRGEMILGGYRLWRNGIARNIIDLLPPQGQPDTPADWNLWNLNSLVIQDLNNDGVISGVCQKEIAGQPGEYEWRAIAVTTLELYSDAGKIHLGFDPPNPAEQDPADVYWASVVQGGTNTILNLKLPVGAELFEWKIAPGDEEFVDISPKTFSNGTTKITLTGKPDPLGLLHSTAIRLTSINDDNYVPLTLNVRVLPQRQLGLAIYSLEDPGANLTHFATPPAVQLPTAAEIVAVCNDCFRQAGISFALHPSSGAYQFPYDTRGLSLEDGYSEQLPVRVSDGVITSDEQDALGTSFLERPPGADMIFPIKKNDAPEIIRIVLLRESGIPYDNVPEDGPKIRGGASGIFLYALNLNDQKAIAAAHEVGHVLGLSTAPEPPESEDGHHDQPPFSPQVDADWPNGIPPEYPGTAPFVHKPTPNRALMQAGTPEPAGLPWVYGRWMRQEDWEVSNQSAGGQQ